MRMDWSSLIWSDPRRSGQCAKLTIFESQNLNYMSNALLKELQLLQDWRRRFRSMRHPPEDGNAKYLLLWYSKSSIIWNEDEDLEIRPVSCRYESIIGTIIEKARDPLVAFNLFGTFRIASVKLGGHSFQLIMSRVEIPSCRKKIQPGNG